MARAMREMAADRGAEDVLSNNGNGNGSSNGNDPRPRTHARAPPAYSHASFPLLTEDTFQRAFQETFKFALPLFWGGSWWNPFTPKRPESGLNVYIGRPIELT